MTEERALVAQAVLEGKLSADHLTMDELDEIQWRVADLVFERELEKAQAAGKAVFEGAGIHQPSV